MPEDVLEKCKEQFLNGLEKSDDAKNLVKDMLYKKDVSHVPSVQHGIANEKIAIEQLKKQICK
ncbi:hypothetical protein JYU34_010360 [Plutella xylostella]|uniref:Uncharacterized protein n=1 Tax=Plutella xylostella TaxID=51655 RepID=A0ABQ7QI91_PLUXY|nr:hypothetical protein JYU34_010360 [Plutella xylostella]